MIVIKQEMRIVHSKVSHMGFCQNYDMNLL